MGPPGSGKGTQAKLLCQARVGFHIASGDIFRSLDPNTDLYEKCSEICSKGGLVDDLTVMELLRKHIQLCRNRGLFSPQKRKICLDGVPRTNEQAQMVKELLDIRFVLLFEVEEDEVLVQRMLARGKKEGRTDDKDREVLLGRIRTYRSSVDSILDILEVPIIRVSSVQPTALVLKDVLNVASDLLLRP